MTRAKPLWSLAKAQRLAKTKGWYTRTLPGIEAVARYVAVDEAYYDYIAAQRPAGARNPYDGAIVVSRRGGIPRCLR